MRDQYTPAYKSMNPQAAVPSVVVDDGLPLTQSLAILEYLEDVHPQPALLPADPRDRARVRSLALLFAANHYPLIVPRVRHYLTDVLEIDDDQRNAWIRDWFREGLVQGEARLADDPATGYFCHGNVPTIADLCLISQVMEPTMSLACPRSAASLTRVSPSTPSPAPSRCASPERRARIERRSRELPPSDSPSLRRPTAI